MPNRWILRASEIDMFLSCQRKWGFVYLENIASESSPAIEFGIKVHKVLEQYLKGYEIKYDTKEGQLASTGLPFLSKNIPYENIEKKFFFESNGHVFSGTPDFFQDLGNNIWLLGDHKTCSSFASTLSSEQLKNNIQANIYAKWLIKEKNADTIKLKWIYYNKSKITSRCVESLLTKDEVYNNFKNIVKIADKIVYLANSNHNTLDKNLKSCFKYGRCAFYSHCLSDKKLPAIQFQLTHKEIKEPIMVNTEPIINKSFDLFIDCLPVKNAKEYKNTIELSELLKPVLEKIQNDKELKHYRLAGYGQHVGLISSYLGEYLKTKAFDQNTAIVSSAKTPEGCDTLQTLMAEASCVFRGF